jgi:hypothetical protein
LIIDSITVNAFDNSDFNLKLNSKLVRITSKKTSNYKLAILCDEIFIRAEESCGIKAVIDTKYINISALDRSAITMNGTCDELEIESLGNSSFKGKNFEAKNAIINATHTSDIYVNALDNLDIFAKNSSEVYIYSNPKITISEFYDKSSLHKREID